MKHIVITECGIGKIKKEQRPANSTYKKLAVQWLNEHLCFIASFVLVDSFVLRNRQLLVAAKRYGAFQLTMNERIILSIVAMLMLVQTFRIGDRLSIILTFGLLVGILITWSQEPILINAGLVCYLLTTIIIMVNCLLVNSLSRLHQVAIFLAGIWNIGSILFSVMQWPGAAEIRISTIIPLSFFIISLFKGILTRKEVGYLTVLNAELIIYFFR